MTMTQLWMSRPSRPSPLESPHRGPTLRNKQSAALTACRTRAPARFCNKPSVVKIREKWLLSLLRCPLGLSVNMKDTAGCGVMIKRLPVHKQLINKRRPSPLPTRLSVSFPFYDRSVLQPLLPWIATSVYYAHGGHSHRHNDTIVTPPPRHGPILLATPGSADIFLAAGIHGKNPTPRLFNDSGPVSLQDVMSSLGCF